MGGLKTLLPLVLALAIAFGGSSYIYKWLESKSVAAETVEVQAAAVPVVVAAMDLPWGTKINTEMLKTVPFLKESLPNGYVSDRSSLEGRILISPVSSNEPITQSRVATDDISMGGVSAILSPGKRAIAVQGDKVIGISGFIRPGNVVDVLVTMRNPKTKGEETKLVLEKIPVLATGTEITQNERGQPAPVDVYTLEVTPAEAETLTLASTQGMLRFALRNITDTESVVTKGATISETLQSLRNPEPVIKRPRTARPTAAPLSTTVQQIRGDQVSEQKFD